MEYVQEMYVTKQIQLMWDQDPNKELVKYALHIHKLLINHTASQIHAKETKSLLDLEIVLIAPEVKDQLMMADHVLPKHAPRDKPEMHRKPVNGQHVIVDKLEMHQELVNGQPALKDKSVTKLDAVKPQLALKHKFATNKDNVCSQLAPTVNSEISQDNANGQHVQTDKFVTSQDNVKLYNVPLTLDTRNNTVDVELILAKTCRLSFLRESVKVVNMEQSPALTEENVRHVYAPLDNM